MGWRRITACRIIPRWEMHSHLQHLALGSMMPLAAGFAWPHYFPATRQQAEQPQLHCRRSAHASAHSSVQCVALSQQTHAHASLFCVPAVPQEHTAGAQSQDWLQVPQGLWQGHQALWAMPWQDRQVTPHPPQERGAEKEEKGTNASLKLA